MSAEEHKKNTTNRLMHWNGLVNNHEGWQRTNAIEALVEATLYAAEQQRVANLIAYADSRVANGYPVKAEILEEIDRAMGLTSRL